MEDNQSTTAATIGKSLRSRANRRSLSGAPITSYLFETKFQHFKTFQKNQSNSKGLNFLLAPPSSALYRSSLPVTPISTPIANQSIRFTEQSLRNRILSRGKSPRRGLWSPNGQADISEDHESQSRTQSEGVSESMRVNVSETIPAIQEPDLKAESPDIIQTDFSPESIQVKPVEEEAGQDDTKTNKAAAGNKPAEQSQPKPHRIRKRRR